MQECMLTCLEILQDMMVLGKSEGFQILNRKPHNCPARLWHPESLILCQLKAHLQ